MVSLNKFVEKFEKEASVRHLYLKKEDILEERIIAYNEINNNTEQYILEKEKSSGLSSKVQDLGEEGVGKQTSFPSKIETIFFKSENSIEELKRSYFIRFSFDNAIDYHKEIWNRLNPDIVSLDIGIYRKNSENEINPGKVNNIFNLHYGIFERNVISKDIHNRKQLFFADKTSLKKFVDFRNELFNDSGGFILHESGSNASGIEKEFLHGYFSKLYDNLGVAKGIFSDLIFDGFKKRDIAIPLQGVDLFFYIVDKIGKLN